MPNWAALRECGQGPLQFYWFHAAAQFFFTFYFVGIVTGSRRLYMEILLSVLLTKSDGLWSL